MRQEHLARTGADEARNGLSTSTTDLILGQRYLGLEWDGAANLVADGATRNGGWFAPLRGTEEDYGEMLGHHGRAPFRALSVLLAATPSPTVPELEALIEALLSRSGTLNEDDVRDGLRRCVIADRCDLMSTLLAAPVTSLTRHQLAMTLRGLGFEVQLRGTPTLESSGLLCELMIAGGTHEEIAKALATDTFAGKLVMSHSEPCESDEPIERSSFLNHERENLRVLVQRLETARETRSKHEAALKRLEASKPSHEQKVQDALSKERQEKKAVDKQRATKQEYLDKWMVPFDATAPVEMSSWAFSTPRSANGRR